MTRWLRFSENGAAGFGTLEADDVIHVHRGDMFASPTPTERRVTLGDVALLTPCEPTKMLALWNNFHALAEKNQQAKPAHPLYFHKSPNSYLPGGGAIKRPKAYAGRIVYEGELGIVIGKASQNISEAEADAHIFGYTCINDVTALELIAEDPSFGQWARAKGCDTFGVFGPVIATGLAPDALTIRTLVNGRERQNYPASDMIHKPRAIVAKLSQDMTLFPGDVICCGTSLGVLPIKEGTTVEIVIDGIGTLKNMFG